MLSALLSFLRKKSDTSAHTASLQFLKRELISNVADDINYRSFPEIPKGLVKETYRHGPYEMKALLSHRQGQERLSLRLRKNGRFVGTLVLCARHEFLFMLPELAPRDQEIRVLLDGLLEMNAYDQAARSGKRDAA